MFDKNLHSTKKSEGERLLGGNRKKNKGEPLVNFFEKSHSAEKIKRDFDIVSF